MGILTNKTNNGIPLLGYLVTFGISSIEPRLCCITNSLIILKVDEIDVYEYIKYVVN